MSRPCLPKPCWGLPLAGVLALATPGPPPAATPLTLEQARGVAVERHPRLLAERAAVDETRGRLLTARLYPTNPRLEVEAGRRRGADGDSTDRGLRLTQEVELGGRRGLRRTAAEADLDAAAARYARSCRRILSEVEAAYAEAVRARELAAIAELDAALQREFLDYTEKSLDAGAATRLEVNLARATRGRAERRLARAEAAAVEARAALALAVGLEPGSLPEPTGELPAPREVTTPLPELLRRAGERRADLTAFRHRREAASARVQLARSRRLPDLELGAFYEREEGTDEIVGVGVGVAIPIFNRNQGGVAEAEATRDRLDQERSALQLAVAEEVVTAHARVRSATRAAELLRGEVLGSLEESLELLRRAFEAGKIGATEVLLFRRELVESRREHVEALAEAWLGRVALDLAAGRVDGCPIEEETP